jgi:hypothetical protein
MSDFAKILEHHQYSHFSSQLVDSNYGVSLTHLRDILSAIEDEMLRIPNRDHSALQNIITPLRGTLDRLEFESSSTVIDKQQSYVLRKFMRRDFDELYEMAQKVDSGQVLTMANQLH